MQHPKLTSRPRWGVRFLILFCVVQVLIPVFNQVAKKVASHHLGKLVNGNATIDRITLGAWRIHVLNLNVSSSSDQRPLLSVKEINVYPTFIQGLRSGSWCSVFFDRPQVQLQFDEKGNLKDDLSKLLTSDGNSEPTTRLPLKWLRVRNARIAIHQTGRQSLDIDRMHCLVIGEKHLAKLRGTVPHLLGASISLAAEVDLTNQTARTQLKLTDLTINSKAVATYPFVPVEAGDWDWNLQSTLELHQHGSVKDWVRTNLTIYLSECRLDLEGQPMLDIKGTTSAVNGKLELNLKGTASRGKLAINARGELQAESPHGEISVRCEQIATHGLPANLLPAGIDASANIESQLKATWEEDGIELNGVCRFRGDESRIHDVVIAPAALDVSVKGKLRPDALEKSDGGISATLVSDGISLDQFLASHLRRLPALERSKLATSLQTSANSEQKTGNSLTGKVRAAVKLQVPLSGVGSPTSYSVDGSVNATGVVWNDWLVEKGLAHILVKSGDVSIRGEDLTIRDVVSNESIRLGLQSTSTIDSDEIEFELTSSRYPLDSIVRLSGESNRHFGGTLSLRVWGNVPRNRLTDRAAWTANVECTADGLQIDQSQFLDGRLQIRLEDGHAEWETIGGHFAGGPCSLEGTLDINEPYRFSADLRTERIDVPFLAKVATPSNDGWQDSQGVIGVRLSAHGRLLDRHLRADAEIRSHDIRWKRHRIIDSSVFVSLTPNALWVNSRADSFLGGKLQLRVHDLAELDLNRIKVSGQIQDLPISSIGSAAGIEQFDGTLSCDLEFASLSDWQRLNGVTRFHIPHSNVFESKVQDVRGDIRFEEGAVAVRLDGKTLGGRAEAHANGKIALLSEHLSSFDKAKWSEFPVDFQASLEDLDLERLVEVANMQDQLRPLRGKISGRLHRGEAQQEQGLLAIGQLQVEKLRWDHLLWSNSIVTSVNVGNGILEIRELKGRFADGRIHGRGRVALDRSLDGFFEASASRVSIGKMLVPVDPRRQLADGSLSLHLKGRLGPRPSGNLIASVENGNLGPLRIDSSRVPVDWSLYPKSKLVQWRTSNASVETGGGRIITNADGRWNGKLDLNLASRIHRVNTSKMLKGTKVSGGGFVDGKVHLVAKRAHSAKDFNGSFDATLSEANSLQLPVVSDLTKFLTTLPTTTQFDESRVRGRLGKGIVYIDQATLAAPNAQILADGTVTLEGRLNVQVMARTEETGPADKLLELADSPLLAAAPTPLTMVAKANNALKDRVVHLRVAGTAARPVIRLEPAKQLGQEAIKFFMNQAIAFRRKSDDKLD